MSLPRIGLIFTGGTIESLGRDRLDLASYAENGQRLSNEQLINRLPELDRFAKIQHFPFRKLPSQSLVTADWVELAHLVDSIFASGTADGLVITHGTNTLEETAYFLHLTARTRHPIVLVGSMRPPSSASADGDLNLLNAVAVAATPDAAGFGVLIVLNDTIHSARDATKTATYRVNAFGSRDLGPLGYADADGRIVLYHKPVRRHTSESEFDATSLTGLPRVDVVSSYVGADGTFIDAAVAGGASGIVSAGMGAGKVTPAEDAALQRARENGVMICIGTRVGSGRVSRSSALSQKGFVTCDNLVPWKARILLALALTKTDSPDEIQRIFDTY